MKLTVVISSLFGLSSLQFAIPNSQSPLIGWEGRGERSVRVMDSNRGRLFGGLLSPAGRLSRFLRQTCLLLFFCESEYIGHKHITISHFLRGAILNLQFLAMNRLFFSLSHRMGEGWGEGPLRFMVRRQSALSSSEEYQRRLTSAATVHGLNSRQRSEVFPFPARPSSAVVQ